MTRDPDFGWHLPPGCTVQEIDRAALGPEPEVPDAEEDVEAELEAGECERGKE